MLGEAELETTEVAPPSSRRKVRGCKSSEVQHPRRDVALMSAAESHPQLMLSVGEPRVALSSQSPQWVIKL